MLSNILYCLSKGYLPQVKYTNTQSGINLWEQFLKQPYSNTIIKRNNQNSKIIKCDVKYANFQFPKFPTAQDIDYFSKLFKSFIVFNDTTMNYFENEYNALLKGKRVLGVLCRGTDYTANKPSGHPIQPEINDVIHFVNNTITELKYDYIYLATEEEKILKIFENAFPNKIITNKRHYYDAFYDLKEKYGDIVRISWIKNEGDTTNYYKSLEYMSSIFLLSKCNALVGGSCGGTQAALYLNNNHYEFWHLFNLGLY